LQRTNYDSYKRLSLKRFEMIRRGGLIWAALFHAASLVILREDSAVNKSDLTDT